MEGMYVNVLLVMNLLISCCFTNVRKGCFSDLLEENVLQPLLVTQSAISLASETVRMILKIDDMIGAI